MLSFGQLFGSNFWSSFKQQPSESIENLLKQEDCKLEDLLDDGDLLQECKNSNKNLIKYLDREKIKQLIDFITVMPETDEHNRGHKYPFIANEVFNCDMAKVTDRFFISPADDIEEEEPDEQAEAEDGNKSEPGFEKDNDDSEDDSEEAEFNNEGEADHDKKADDADKEDDPKDDDKKDEQEITENKETVTEDDHKKDSDEKTGEEEKVDQKDTPEETSSDKVEQKVDPSDETKVESGSPSTEPASDKKEETPEETQKEASPKDSQEAASPPTTAENEESKVEETVQSKDKASEETTAQAPESENKEESATDASTHMSESESEATLVPQEPLSTNKYDLLDYLNVFIETENVLNDVLSGYFARLLTILIQKKSEEVATYYYTHEELLYRFAYHTYSKSITDTVIKILDINTDNFSIEADEVERIRKEFIKRLLQRLGDHQSEECYEYSLNIFQIFNDLTFKSAYYKILIDMETVNTLKEILFKPESVECSANAAIRILNVLITHLRTDLSSSSDSNIATSSLMMEDEVVLEDDDAKTKEQTTAIEEQLSEHPFVTFFKDSIVDHLVAQLEKVPTRTQLDFQYGENQPILGKKRLACINLLESLVELNENTIREKILETNFYVILFDLFLTYKYNTFLQLHLDTIFHCILKDSNTSDESKVKFLQKLGIMERLPEFWEDNQNFAFPSQREFRHGYLAFTTRFANTLKDVGTNIPEVEEMICKQSWLKFVTEDVEIYNQKNAINLANRGAERKDSDEFDNELEDRFGGMDERDDFDDDDEPNEEEDNDKYKSNRTSMRNTLQKYDPSEAVKEHENDFVGESIEKDKEEENLFSGINTRPQDDDSDEDKPIGGNYDDSSDEDSENEKEDVSEDSGYYDNSYWEVNQYSIEDLLQA